MTPKDREHRIDTGSPEERVKQVYPNAYATHAIYEDSVRRLRIFTIWRPQPGAEKDCVQRLSGGWDTSEEKAWESAASRLEDQMTASDHLKPSPRQTTCWSCGAPFNWLIHTVCPVCFAWPKRVIEQIAKERP